MKIRIGFVSNSSTSSFFAYGLLLDSYKDASALALKHNLNLVRLDKDAILSVVGLGENFDNEECYCDYYLCEDEYLEQLLIEKEICSQNSIELVKRLSSELNLEIFRGVGVFYDG